MNFVCVFLKLLLGDRYRTVLDNAYLALGYTYMSLSAF